MLAIAPDGADLPGPNQRQEGQTIAVVALTAFERARLGALLSNRPRPPGILQGTWVRMRSVDDVGLDVFRLEDVAAVLRAYPQAAKVIGLVPVPPR
jgi:hypothetical protein